MIVDEQAAELDKVIALLGAAIPRLEQLSASHDRLLTAAKRLRDAYGAPNAFRARLDLDAAISAAEEISRQGAIAP